MEAKRRQQQPQSGQAEAAWQAVRLDKRLRGEAKLAWQYLFETCGKRLHATVATSPIDVGAWQGKTHASGQRALTALIGRGYLELVDKIDGVWRVYVVDPAELGTARRRTYTPQEELFGLDEEADGTAAPDAAAAVPRPTIADARPQPRAPSAPADRGAVAEVSSHPRRAEAARATFEEEKALTPSPSNLNLPPSSGLRPSRPSEPPDAAPLNFVDRAAALGARLPTVSDDERVAAIARQIDAAVSDPRLRNEPKLRVARAVASGDLDAEVLRDVLAWIRDGRDSGRLKTQPWMAFVGTMKTKFQNAGLFWPPVGGKPK